MADINDRQAVWQKLNTETGRIAWQDLQTFFAAGQVVFVEQGLDLIEVGVEFSQDNKAVLEPLIRAGKMAVVDDQLAQQWLAESASVWALVIAPWVLVQRIVEEK